MGYIKELTSEVIAPPFPQAQFEISGEVPNTQCAEAKIESNRGTVVAGGHIINDPGKFVGWNLIGKFCTIFSPDFWDGTYLITFNGDHDIVLAGIEFDRPWEFVNYFIHNGGSLELTRNAASFAAFIHAAGYAYTFKGAKLYSNIPNAQLQPACSITWEPLS